MARLSTGAAEATDRIRVRLNVVQGRRERAVTCATDPTPSAHKRVSIRRAAVVLSDAVAGRPRRARRVRRSKMRTLVILQIRIRPINIAGEVIPIGLLARVIQPLPHITRPIPNHLAVGKRERSSGFITPLVVRSRERTTLD